MNLQDRVLKKQLKSDVNRISLAVILNSLLLFVIVFMSMIVRSVIAVVNAQTADTEKMFDEIGDNMVNSGVEYLVFSVLGVFLVWLFTRKRISGRQFFSENQRMDICSFFKCFTVFMGIQLPFSLLASAVEAGLNQFGYTAEAGADIATGGSLTVSMFLYSSFIGPVAEELVYRGFVMKSLQKYGKSFAIVISAVLFGVMHQNLVQSVFGIAAGLVLGYVAMNYSIKWSVLFHILNNCLFSDVLCEAVSGFSDSVQTVIIYGIMAVFFISAGIVLAKDRNLVRNKIKEWNEEKGCYKYAFSSLWFLIFIVASSILSLQVIEKM